MADGTDQREYARNHWSRRYRLHPDYWVAWAGIAVFVFMAIFGWRW